MSQIEVSGPAA